jgi:hypothetical protein
MFVAVALITAFLVGGTARRGLIPGRVQSMVENRILLDILTARLAFEFGHNWWPPRQADEVPGGESTVVRKLGRIKPRRQ